MTLCPGRKVNGVLLGEKRIDIFWFNGKDKSKVWEEKKRVPSLSNIINIGVTTRNRN